MSNWLGEILEVSIRPAWQDNGYFKVMPDGKSRVVFEDAQTWASHRNDPCRRRTTILAGQRGVSNKPAIPMSRSCFQLENNSHCFLCRKATSSTSPKIRESLDAMHRRYIRNGYINFVTTPNTEVPDATQRISIIFELDQGKQFRISKVEVHGLDPGREAVLLSKLHPGDIFRNSAVEDAVQSLAPRPKRRRSTGIPQAAQEREERHGRNHRRFKPTDLSRVATRD